MEPGTRLNGFTRCPPPLLHGARPRWRMFYSALAAGLTILLVALALGCDQGDGGAGPCSHEYRDAILQIKQVRDSQTQDALSSVVLTEFTIGGLSVALPTLIEQFADNVELVGDSLRCTPPCGFGTTEGHYQFTSAAPGYTARVLSFDVAYEEFEGGCPSHNSGGLEIEIELDPR